MSDLSYRASGVDQSGADALIPVYAALAKRASRPEVTGEIGGFAGLFSLGDGRALAMSTDGVGTKTELLRERGLHHVAGWDAVAMNVDDVVCCGAEPIMCVDYISIEQLDPEILESVASGVADACLEAGCAFVGGETSQHPGAMLPGSYDVVGTVVGIVQLDDAWGPERVQVGDAIIGMASSGLHANGYSLVRRMLASGIAEPDGLFEPTRIYTKALLSLGEATAVHAAAHVTGGGVAGNLERVLSEGLGATVRRDSWARPEVFAWLAEHVDETEMEATFNCGLGMLAVVPDGESALTHLRAYDVDSWIVGEVTTDPGVRLV